MTDDHKPNTQPRSCNPPLCSLAPLFPAKSQLDSRNQFGESPDFVGMQRQPIHAPSTDATLTLLHKSSKSFPPFTCANTSITPTGPLNIDSPSDSIRTRGNNAGEHKLSRERGGQVGASRRASSINTTRIPLLCPSLIDLELEWRSDSLDKGKARVLLAPAACLSITGPRPRQLDHGTSRSLIRKTTTEQTTHHDPFFKCELTPSETRGNPAELTGTSR